MNHIIAERIPELPLIVFTIRKGFCVEHDLADAEATARSLLAQAEEPLFSVIDLTSLDDDVEKLLAEARASQGSLWNHAGIRETILICDPRKAAVRSRERLQVMADFDQALDYLWVRLDQPAGEVN